MQHDATGDVVVPQSLYAQLLRDSEEYAALLAHRTLPGGLHPPGGGGGDAAAGPVLDAALVERVSLLEIRASVSLRQARLPAAQAGAQGVPPKRLAGVPDAFQGVFHVEPKRLMVFRAGEGTSRLVLQMNFTDTRGLPVDAFLHEGRPRVVVLSDPETGRVAELAMDDAGAADALFAAVALRLHAKEHRAAAATAAAGGGAVGGDGGARVSPHRSRQEAVVRMPSSKVRDSVNAHVRGTQQGYHALDRSPLQRHAAVSDAAGPIEPMSPSSEAALLQMQADRVLLEQRVSDLTHDVRAAHEELAHSKAQTAAASAAAAAAAAASAAAPAPERLPPYRQQQPLLTQQQLQQHLPPSAASPPPPPPPPLPQLLHHDEVGHHPSHHPQHEHQHQHQHHRRDAPTQQQATLSRPALEEHYRAHPECQPHGTARTFFSSNPLDGLVRLCAAQGCVFRDHDFDTDAVDPVLAACAGGGGVVFRRLGSGFGGGGGGGQPPLLPASGAAPAGDEIDWGPTDLARWVVGCVAVAVQEFSAQGREAQRDPATAKSMGGARFMVRPREANGHGVYTVRLFVDDAWRYVVVDDRVPCSAASGRPLLPTVIGGEGPMFLPLVVKALAKLHGGYGALAAAATLSKRPSRGLQHPYGHVAEALCDLSGGAALLPALPHPRSEKFAAPWTTRDAAGARGDALEAFCDALWEALDELLVEAAAEVVAVAAADGAGGLAPGAVYRVLETASAEETAAGAGERSTLRLLRLHAPYGDAPWTGAWAPGSREWSAAPRLAAALCPRAEADGSFWVEFVDLLNSFEYCAAVKMFTGWNELSLSGAMLCGGLRGGGGGRAAASGPWYQMQVTQACTVFVSVQQRDPRVTDKEYKSTHLVGFKVVAEGDVSGAPALVPSPLTKRLAHHLSHGPQPTYALGMLEAGTYYVVPTCDVVHANPRMQESLRSNRTEVDFTLRVFAKSAFVLVEKQGAPPA